jgi:hypothetical protein
MAWGRVVSWRNLKFQFIAILLLLPWLTVGPSLVAQPTARRCDGSYCYEKICTPGQPSCRYVANRVCKPTTKEECTTQNVKKCHRVPLTACASQSANSCRPHLKRVCGYTSRYRTYAAEELSYYKKIPHLRPRRSYVGAPHASRSFTRQARGGQCHLQVVRECSYAPKPACQQAYKDECRYVPEKSCSHREVQDCYDERKYVCDKGSDNCYERRIARAPVPYPPDGGGTYPKVVPPPDEKALPPVKPDETYNKPKPEEPYEKPEQPPAPSKEAMAPPLPAGSGQPAPAMAESARQEQPRQLVIDTRVVMVPIAGGLAAFGLFLLFVSQRRKSQAKDRNGSRDVHIGYRGKPDPGTQYASHLAVRTIGPRLTLRTVSGQHQVNITMAKNLTMAK